jgi:hypothetical protein
MKLVGWVVFALLAAASLRAQAVPVQNAAPVPQTSPVPPPQSGFPSQPMTRGEINTWHMQRMLQLMAELKAMHSKLDEKKANTAKVKDPALRQQLQLDNELWAMMLSHLEAMTAEAPQNSRSSRFGSAAQRYRQQQMSLPRTEVPAAPAAPETKPAAPPDHP